MHTTRRDFLKSTGAGTACLLLTRAGFAGPAKGGKRPNIILMMVDDFGYECLGCNGGGPYKTPNLDALAAEGMRFVNCHAQPLCTPSRVEIMTGRYNFRNYRRFGTLEKDQKTFAHVLKDAGYATCIVGKWQLGRDRKLIKHFGFDEHCLWWLENRGQRYMNPDELMQNGNPRKDLKGEYGPDVVSDFMLDFITRHKAEAFLCYYPMILTHSPYVPTPDSANPKKKARGGYFVDMVRYTDKIVGKIVAHLKKLGLYENTVILFTGDNGTGRGIRSTLNGRPWAGGKGGVGENGTHVPLIAGWPGGGVKGAVLDDLVDFTDFLPTLAELAGAKPPEGVVVDGRSFAARLRGQKGNPREWIYFWYSGRGGKTGRSWTRDKRFKLYASGEMFDMAADPHQKQPLPPESSDAAAVSARKKLQAALDRMHKEITKAGCTVAPGPGPGKAKKKKRNKGK